MISCLSYGICEHLLKTTHLHTTPNARNTLQRTSLTRVFAFAGRRKENPNIPANCGPVYLEYFASILTSTSQPLLTRLKLIFPIAQNYCTILEIKYCWTTEIKKSILSSTAQNCLFKTIMIRWKMKVFEDKCRIV